MPVEIVERSSNLQVKSNTKYKSNNVAPPPEYYNGFRKRQAGESLQCFLETYFPEIFCLEWSEDHLKIIDQIEHRVNEGGLKALAMPRGSGKTSIITYAALWAILTGRRRFVCVIGANEHVAIGLLKNIKTAINHNDKLATDYALELHCVRRLSNEPRRATNQHFNGEPTGVMLEQRLLQFGSIPGSPTSGSAISVAGITGQIRGQQILMPDGTIVRPDLVLVDDPQTKLSAASKAQCQKRYEIMVGDVLGMAGPGVKIAGFCTCTVIYPDDLADRLLDQELAPEWNGSKISMIKSWPKNMDLWDEYHVIWGKELAEDKGFEESTQFVRDNYEAMHAGASVYWEARMDRRDVSALHHAMNLYFRDQGVFAAEYQNLPKSVLTIAPYDINPNQLMERTVGIPRGRIPNETDKITAFIDVQRECLFYVIMAWDVSGRGYIIDFGTCPDQQAHHFSKVGLRSKITDVFGDELEDGLLGALDMLTKAILDNDYTTESGAMMQVDKLAIDARWGESTEIVRRFVRESKFRQRMHPSMGFFVGANSRQWQKLKSKKGDREGTQARLKIPENRGARELQYDTNFWKSFVAARLTCRQSSPKAIVFFDAPKHILRLPAEHCAAETPVRVIGKDDNEVVEWKQQKGGSAPDNDFWDCIVGNAALASVIGVKTHEGAPKASNISHKTIKKLMAKKGWNK